MIEQSTLKFLAGLKKNNNKNWFLAHQDAYLKAKENVEAFAGEMLKQLATLDPGFHDLSPKDCTYRIYRDVRFSADKTPYKTNMGVYFNAAGKKADAPGYYVHIEPGAAFVAAGMWMPEKDKLKAIRQEIDYNADDLEKIMSATAFKKVFENSIGQNEALQRMPKGYEDDNPAAQYLKLKSFVVRRKISDEDLQKPGAVKALFSLLKTAIPFNEFLKRAID